MEKRFLLNQMIFHLSREEKLFLQGKDDEAIELEELNVPILEKLQKIDLKLQDASDSLPFLKEEIELNDEIFALVEDARKLQTRVFQLLLEARDKAKSEYVQTTVKRQLDTELHSPLWKKNYC